MVKFEWAKIRGLKEFFIADLLFDILDF